MLRTKMINNFILEFYTLILVMGAEYDYILTKQPTDVKSLLFLKLYCPPSLTTTQW